jgi:Ribbon-helix-helix protein, copG family
MGSVNNGKPEKRRRGRPARPEGRDPVVAVRLPPAALAVVDEYAAEMGGITRSKALRDMVNHAIEHWGKMKKRRKA